MPTGNTETGNNYRYYGFVIASLLSTNSALRRDYSSLPTSLKTPENLRKLIRNSLYTQQPGVKHQQLDIQEPAQTNPDIEKLVSLIDVDELHAKWNTLSVASETIDQALAGLFDDYNGSCPSPQEQAKLYKAVSNVG